MGLVEYNQLCYVGVNSNGYQLRSVTERKIKEEKLATSVFCHGQNLSKEHLVNLDIL